MERTRRESRKDSGRVDKGGAPDIPAAMLAASVGRKIGHVVIGWFGGNMQKSNVAPTKLLTTRRGIAALLGA